MDRRLALTTFQRAPAEYSQDYLNNLMNMLNVLVTSLRSAGEGRQSTLVITNMPDGDNDLEEGTLFQINGAVYVSMLNRVFLGSLSAKGRVGLVTVTTV